MQIRIVRIFKFHFSENKESDDQTYAIHTAMICGFAL